MDIYVNDEQLDFQLEHENNLKEVIEAINDWLFQNLKVIDEIIIDGKVFTEEIQELTGYSIDSTEKLQLTIVDINQLVHNSLTETKKYLTEISKYIESKTDFTEEDITRLITGINWTINIFVRINKIYNYEKHFTDKKFHFKNELETLEKTKSKMEEYFQAKILDKINEILHKSVLNQLTKWIENINILLVENKSSIENMESIREKISDQIFTIIHKIPDMQKMIEMTVMDMQTGHEKEAMTNIQIIIGSLESIFALLQLIKSTFSLDYHQIKYNDETIEKINKDMTEALKELLQSMEIKDTVLLTDLLNYELSPKLEQYAEVLKLIAKEINIEIN